MRPLDWPSLWWGGVASIGGSIFAYILYTISAQLVSSHFLLYVAYGVLGSICATLIHDRIEKRPRRIYFYPETSQRLFRGATTELLRPLVEHVTQAIDANKHLGAKTLQRVKLCENNDLLTWARTADAAIILELYIAASPVPHQTERSDEAGPGPVDLPQATDPKDVSIHQFSEDMANLLKSIDGNMAYSFTRGLYFGLFYGLLMPSGAPIPIFEEPRGLQATPLTLPRDIEEKAGLVNGKAWKPTDREKVAAAVHFVEEVKVQIEQLIANTNARGYKTNYHVQVGIGKPQTTIDLDNAHKDAALEEGVRQTVAWEQQWINLGSDLEIGLEAPGDTRRASRADM